MAQDKPGEPTPVQGGDTDAVVVYTTYPSETEAVAAAEALVQAGLVACANILPGMKAVFIWDGQLERATEVVMILKTRRALVREVIAAVKRLHSYQNPAVVVWPIIAGSPDYLGWIGAQTAFPQAG